MLKATGFMPYMQSLKQVSDLCQGPPRARNHLAVRIEVKINSRLSPAILRVFPVGNWRSRVRSGDATSSVGGQREGCLLCPRDLPVLKRREGLSWVTAEKNRTFWKWVEGQRGKNGMAKRDLLANVSWLSMSSIPLLPCSPWQNLEHFSGGD